MLLLLFRLHNFASDQKKEEGEKKRFCFFWQLLSNFRREEQLLTFFGATCEQLFEKFRATFWEISSNMWQALVLHADKVKQKHTHAKQSRQTH